MLHSSLTVSITVVFLSADARPLSRRGAASAASPSAASTTTATAAAWKRRRGIHVDQSGEDIL